MVKVLAKAGIARCGSTSTDSFELDMKAKHQHKQLFAKVVNCKPITENFPLALSTPKLYNWNPDS